MFAARLAVTAARTAHAAATVVCTDTASGSQGGHRALASCPWHLVQLSHSAYYVGADPVAAGACRQDGPDRAKRGPFSATNLSESNCYCTDGRSSRPDEARKAGALEGLRGLETRPRAWFPRFPWLLDRRVLHGIQPAEDLSTVAIPSLQRRDSSSAIAPIAPAPSYAEG